ncbi:oligosaccharide flippase family protein [Metabacillus fastidiosus]|uniref:Oligosaccharide flippase family protein n=1 Tax=Metabacillus fastidiosus TaxID=1458 RepID=A0ABU6NUT7_9BACI|nr:oligosaccharide flippase family protein [Metabacillus fastidiosus]MED4400909.1 oligosaccharide flippase family protein [Metabacillus fastidiosus]MED4463835.1 oligosaccharide flippase family protein [Metabacillus fastidiosus]
MSISGIKRGIITSYSLKGADLLSALLFTPFLISLLGQSEYGIYTLIGALIGSLAILEFGFRDSITKYIFKYKMNNEEEKESRLLSMCIILYGVIAFLCLAAGLLMYPFLEWVFGGSLNVQEMATAKLIYFISLFSVCVSFFLGAFQSYIQGHKKYMFINRVMLLRLLLRMVLVSIFLLFGFKAVTVVIIDALLNIGTVVIFTFFSFKKLNIKLKFVKLNIQFLKESSGYSTVRLLGNIANVFYWRIGLIVIGCSIGSMAVAVYSIAIILVGYYEYFSKVIHNKISPYIAKMITNGADEEELTKVCSKIGRIQFFLLGGILLGFLLFGKEFILLWLGFDYEASYWISLLLMTAMFFQSIQYSAVLVLREKKREKLRMMLQLSTVVLGILFGFIFNIFYGTIGMGIGVAAAVIVLNGSVVHFVYIKVFSFHFSFFLKELLKIIPSMSVALLVSLPIYFWSFQSWGTFLLKCILFLIIYISVFWFIGANYSEKILFKSIMRKNIYSIKEIIIRQKSKDTPKFYNRKQIINKEYMRNISWRS